MDRKVVIGVAWPKADYVSALEQAGAEVRELTPARDQLPTALDECDGLLLTGGPDVDPRVGGRAHVEASRRPPRSMDQRPDEPPRSASAVWELHSWRIWVEIAVWIANRQRRCLRPSVAFWRMQRRVLLVLASQRAASRLSVEPRSREFLLQSERASETLGQIDLHQLKSEFQHPAAVRM